MRVNGDPVVVTSGAHDRLIDVLRNQLGLTGTKESCGVGECGSCTVLIGGVPTLACITLAARVTADVETIEGVVDESYSLRTAIARSGGLQCGFCTPGMVMSAVALLRRQSELTEADVRHGLAGNICRCTGYVGIVQAVLAVAEQADKELPA